MPSCFGERKKKTKKEKENKKNDNEEGNGMCGAGAELPDGICEGSLKTSIGIRDFRCRKRDALHFNEGIETIVGRVRPRTTREAFSKDVPC